MAEKHKLTVMVPQGDYRAIKIRAAVVGTTISDVTRELLERWVAGELRTEAEAEKRSA